MENPITFFTSETSACASSTSQANEKKQNSNTEGRTSPLSPTLQKTDDAESTAVTMSPDIPIHKLWDGIWGKDHLPPPRPSNMQTVSSGEEESKEDILLQLAAACSVPIDLDEDTFIIDGPRHLRAVHDLTMVPLQQQRFDYVLSILNKLLTSLKISKNTKFEHLKGCTHHNIGMIQTCQGNFHDALDSFEQAVKIRSSCLPPNHPDIAVSLVRQGLTQFALEEFDEAVISFISALNMTPAANATRGKILNNIGVAQYQRQDYSEALKMFTGALEIQRQWLDGPVRREPIVYDAVVTLSNMGKVYLRKADYDLAYFVYEEACMVSRSFSFYARCVGSIVLMFVLLLSAANDHIPDGP
jgi:tetratricopeptide (TPR) repeat protein